MTILNLDASLGPGPTDVSPDGTKAHYYLRRMHRSSRFNGPNYLETQAPFPPRSSAYAQSIGLAAATVARPLVRSKNWLSGLIALLILVGCVKTELRPPPLEDELLQLATVNARPIVLQAESRLKSSSAGHQYLLVALPIGSVRIQAPVDFLFNEAYTALALKGYRPITATQAAVHKKTIPRLQLTLLATQVSAFDFLFFRRLVSTVDVSARLFDGHNQELRSWQARATTSRFSRFGFKQQLEPLLESAFKQAVSETVLHLAL